MLARGVHARVAAVLAALLALSVLGTPTAAALPAEPTGLAPGNGQTIDASPVLTWDRSPDATSYDVEVSARSDFTTKLYSVTTVNRRATPTAQLPMTDVYWRVRAKASSGTSAWTTASFVRSRLAGPVLQAPADGDLLQPPVEPVVLRWNPVAGASSYTVEIDRGPDPDWVGTVSSSTATTSYTPGPLAGGSWSWRVTATLGAGQLTFASQERAFSVGELGNVNVTLPAEGQDLEDVVLDWDPVPGAVRYDVRVSTDEQFPAGTIIDDRTVSSTRYSPAETYDVGAYWWQVRAVDALGAAKDWGVIAKHAFTRSWDNRPTAPGHGTDPNPDPDPDGAPRLVYPADDASTAVTGDLYYQWTPVRHAAKYQLEVSIDEAFSPGKFWICTTSHTTYTPEKVKPTACLPQLNGQLWWRVKAIDGPAGVNGFYSAKGTFRYSRDQVPIVSPNGGFSVNQPALVDVPTLKWEPVAGAERYQVNLLSYGGISKSVTTYSTSWTPAALLAADQDENPYKWTVQAVDADGNETPLPASGNGRYLQVSGDIPTTGAAPLTPLDQDAGPTGRFPALRWEPAPAAEHYRLWVGRAGTNTFDLVQDRFEYPAGTETSAEHIGAGNYQWYVEAIDSAEHIIGTGPLGSFTVTEARTVTGQQIALKGTSLDAGTTCSYSLLDQPVKRTCPAIAGTPVLDWQSDPNTAFYIVYLSRDQTFQNMVYGEYSKPKDLPRTYQTRWTKTLTLADSQAGSGPGTGPYYWFIRPCKALNVCAPDPIEANHAFVKRSAPVTLAPVTGTANEITFSWQPYLATNQAAPADPLTGERSDQEARTYEIQVSDTAGMDHLVDDAEVDQPTYTAPTKVYPEGNLFWRVRAYDGDSRPLPWSETQTLLKSSPRPSGTSPSGTVPATEAFRWTVAPFAASYDLEVYKNADTAASSTNLAFRKNVKEAGYAQVTPLAAGMDYVWRTRRVDASSNKGAWSDWTSFRIEGTAPILELPAAGATVPTAESLFTWDPIDGAESYKFERRTVSTGSVDTVVTSALAWAPSSKLPAGASQWRVTSLDASGNVLGSSAWRALTVQGGPAATSTPVVTGSGTVGELLHVSGPAWDVPDVTTSYQWLRNGAAISGATGVDYEVVSTDVGKSLSVRATGTLAGYDAGSALSNAVTGVLGATTTAVTPPTLSGTGRVGSALTATLPTWDQPGVTTTYRWLRDGVAVGSTNSLTFTPRESDLGGTITFEATGKRTGYNNAVVAASGVLVTAGAAATPSVAPAISGQPKVGQSLSVRGGTWPSGVKLSYQWLRDGAPITGATSTSYRLVVADATRALSVLVTATRSGYETGTATTSAVRIARMTSTTKFSLPASTVKARAGKGKVKALVTVTVSGWSTPSGQVRILDGKKVIAKAKLKKNGTAVVRLKGLKKGKHKLVATYDGTTAAAKSTSARLVLKVV